MSGKCFELLKYILIPIKPCSPIKAAHLNLHDRIQSNPLSLTVWCQETQPGLKDPSVSKREQYVLHV